MCSVRVRAALTVQAKVGVIMFLAEIDKLSMAMRPEQTMCPLGLSINRDFKIRGRGRLEVRDHRREIGSRTQRSWREN